MRNPSPTAVQLVTARNALSRFRQHCTDGVVDRLEQEETEENLIELVKLSWQILVNQQYASQCLNTGCENTPNYHLSLLMDKAQAEIEALEQPRKYKEQPLQWAA